MPHALLKKSFRILFYDELSEYEFAIKILSEHLKTHPNDGIAYNNRGLAYSEIGDERALPDFAKAIECSPSDPMPFMNRADVYLRWKPIPRINEAIEDFTEAIRLDGDDATFHRCRAHACMDVSRTKEAIESFSAAIRLDPEFRQTYLDRARAFEKLGQHEDAGNDRTIAAKLPPYPPRK